MKIKIEPLKTVNNSTNEVTSPKIFQDRKPFDKDGTPNFHKEGIFSKKIFGQYGHCNCKENPRTRPGFCDKCETRVLSYKKTPDFYISLKECGVDIPKMYIDYKKYPKLKKSLQKLFDYNAFIYDGQVIDFDNLLNMDLDISEMSNSKLLIGKKAILSLGVEEDWYNEQVTNKLYIPHPAFRPITISNGKHFLGSFNVSLISVLKMKKYLSTLGSENTEDKFEMLIKGQTLIAEVKKVYAEIFQMLGKRKKSIINTEVRGQTLTGAVRGVVTNNFSLDEDEVIIGKYFIKTLYPELAAKYADKVEAGIAKDGSNEKIWEADLDKIDIPSLNKELAEKAYYVLVNRPPTIGEKSIMAMKPRFSLKDEEKYVIQLPPIIQDGFAGDYDGDSFLLIALYTTAANQEAERLLPSKNYIGGADAEIRNGILEEFEYVMQRAYEDGGADADKIHEMIMNG